MDSGLILKTFTHVIRIIVWMKNRVDSDQLVVIYTLKKKRKKKLVWFDSLNPSQQLSGWTVHLTTLFSWASLTKYTFACNWKQHLESAVGRRTTVEILSWSISRKYGTWPGSNSRPLDLQLDALLMALTRPVIQWCNCIIIRINCVDEKQGWSWSAGCDLHFFKNWKKFYAQCTY